MNNERYNQIIDEVYRNYADSRWIPSLDAKPKEEPTMITDMITDWLNEYGDPEIYKKVERELELREKAWFIHEIKTNPKFSERWGLKIEERELSLGERYEIRCKKENIRNDWEQFYSTFGGYKNEMDSLKKSLNGNNIPTKLITVTYKGEKTEIYE